MEPTNPDVVPVDDSDEFINLRGKNAKGMCEWYFKERPELDTPENRNLFYDAYGRGFDSCDRAYSRGAIKLVKYSNYKEKT
jgi:hypothetical protein